MGVNSNSEAVYRQCMYYKMLPAAMKGPVLSGVGFRVSSFNLLIQLKNWVQVLGVRLRPRISQPSAPQFSKATCQVTSRCVLSLKVTVVFGDFVLDWARLPPLLIIQRHTASSLSPEAPPGTLLACSRKLQSV